MTGRLDGKVAVVTGAAQGIGRSIVAAFQGEAARIVAVDLRAEGLADFSGKQVETVALDVTDRAAVAAFGAGRPAPDVLVNCVGLVPQGTILDCTAEELDRAFAVNVGSAYNMIRVCLPGMLERGSGSIINIASVVSSTRGVPNRFAYGTSKAALLGLTKSVARDFIDRGVRCNAISPGTVHTPSLEERLSASGDADNARSQFLARQPMGRFGEPDEIALTAVLLASDEVRFMTGSDIIVDGGMSL